MDLSLPRVPYQEFINKELILYCREDNARSIPSIIDGLKPGQRKILFACFKRNLRKELKVGKHAERRGKWCAREEEEGGGGRGENRGEEEGCPGLPCSGRL